MKNKTKIFIDNMMWDDFLKYNINLRIEFPHDEFELFITAEAHSEIPAHLRNYVMNILDFNSVETDSYFAFSDLNDPCGTPHFDGFGDFNDTSIGGRFIYPEEQSFINIESKIIGPKRRRSGLLNNEADVAIGARSLIGIVLTKDKKGVLKRIPSQYGGKIIDMNDFDGSKILSEYVTERL